MSWTRVYRKTTPAIPLAQWTKKQGNKQMNKRIVFHVTYFCYWINSVLWVIKVLKTRIAYPLNTEFHGVHARNIQVTHATKRKKNVWNNVQDKNDRARENFRVTIKLNGCYKLILNFSPLFFWRWSKNKNDLLPHSICQGYPTCPQLPQVFYI